MTKKVDIKSLDKLYKKNINISNFLKKKSNLTEGEIINLSYDFQSGSYINNYNKKGDTEYRKYQDLLYGQIINEIKLNFPKINSILDFGAGELINTLYLIKKLPNISNFFACDISFNRLFLGKKFLEKKVSGKTKNKINIFCSSQKSLPLKDESIDLSITMHALEPNRKQKKQIVKELLRVSRHGIIMFEPHYERASKMQKKRMDKFNYFRGLEQTIKSLGCKYKIVESNFSVNKANPSSLFIIYKKKLTKNKIKIKYIDDNGQNLEKLDNFLYSSSNFKIFPILFGIPIFSDTKNLFLPKKNLPEN